MSQVLHRGQAGCASELHPPCNTPTSRKSVLGAQHESPPKVSPPLCLPCRSSHTCALQVYIPMHTGPRAAGSVPIYFHLLLCAQCNSPRRAYWAQGLWAEKSHPCSARLAHPAQCTCCAGGPGWPRFKETLCKRGCGGEGELGRDAGPSVSVSVFKHVQCLPETQIPGTPTPMAAIAVTGGASSSPKPAEPGPGKILPLCGPLG